MQSLCHLVTHLLQRKLHINLFANLVKKKFHLEIFVRGFGVIPKIYKTLKGIINVITEKITYQIKIKVSYNDRPTDGIHQY